MGRDLPRSPRKAIVAALCRQEPSGVHRMREMMGGGGTLYLISLQVQGLCLSRRCCWCF